jgi:hypothetical protein
MDTVILCSNGPILAVNFRNRVGNPLDIQLEFTLNTCHRRQFDGYLAKAVTITDTRRRAPCSELP